MEQFDSAAGIGYDTKVAEGRGCDPRFSGFKSRRTPKPRSADQGIALLKRQTKFDSSAGALEVSRAIC